MDLKKKKLQLELEATRKEVAQVAQVLKSGGSIQSSSVDVKHQVSNTTKKVFVDQKKIRDPRMKDKLPKTLANLLEIQQQEEPKIEGSSPSSRKSPAKSKSPSKRSKSRSPSRQSPTSTSNDNDNQSNNTTPPPPPNIREDYNKKSNKNSSRSSRNSTDSSSSSRKRERKPSLNSEKSKKSKDPDSSPSPPPTPSSGMDQKTKKSYKIPKKARDNRKPTRTPSPSTHTGSGSRLSGNKRTSPSNSNNKKGPDNTKKARLQNELFGNDTLAPDQQHPSGSGWAKFKESNPDEFRTPLRDHPFHHNDHGHRGGPPMGPPGPGPRVLILGRQVNISAQGAMT
jgi:hypothetical protein